MGRKKIPISDYIEKQFEGLEFEDDKIDSVIDNDILKSVSWVSEQDYIRTVNYIVENSVKQVRTQNLSKNQLKKLFTIFFIVFISIQYAVLIYILLFNLHCDNAFLSDKLIALYISSIFVETLGGIIVMVKYAFNSNQEVELIKILNKTISSYQKYNSQKQEVEENVETKQKNENE